MIALALLCASAARADGPVLSRPPAEHQAWLLSRAIERLEDLVDSPDDQGFGLESIRPALLLRLGELYFAEAQALYAAEMEAAADAPEDHVLSNGRFLDARAAWMRAVDRYPSFERRDELLYRVGLTSMVDLGERDDAMPWFETLVGDHPRSDRAAAASVHLGDWHLDAGRNRAALISYLRAGQSEYVLEARAPIGAAYCYGRVGDVDRAVAAMRTGLELAMRHEPPETRGTAHGQEIADLMAWYSSAGRVEDALQFAASLPDPGLRSESVERLAALRVKAGEAADATRLYEWLITGEPLSSRVPVWRAAIATQSLAVGDDAALLAALLRFEATCDDASEWSLAQSPETRSACREALADATLRFATDTHRHARKLRNLRDSDGARDAYLLARDLYAFYLSGFGDRPASGQPAYEAGEVAWNLGDPRAAHALYGRALDRLGSDPASEATRFSAEGLVRAADALLVSARAQRGEDPATWDEDEERLYQAALRYESLFGLDTNGAAFVAAAANVLLDNGRIDEAIPCFLRVFEAGTRPDLGVEAVDRIVRSLEDRGRWDDLLTLSRHFYGSANLTSMEKRRELFVLKANAELKQLELAYEANQDPAVHASALRVWHAQYEKLPLAAYALHVAAVRFDEAGDRLAGARTRELLLSRHPEAPEAVDDYRLLAVHLESVGDHAGAASAFEGYAQRATDRERRIMALDAAITLRDALGHPDATVRNVEALLALKPAEDVVLSARYVLAEQHREANRPAAALAVFESLMRDAPAEFAFPARLQAARVHAESGRDELAARLEREGRERFETLDPATRGDPRVADAMAELSYRSLDARMRLYRALRLSGPETRGASRSAEDRALQGQIAQKTSSMAALEADYAAIVQIGSPHWTVASYARIGILHENMAASLRSSYVPSYLTGQQREVYRGGLEDAARASEERAIEAYSLAVEAAWVSSRWSDEARSSLRRLHDLAPEAFPPMYETLPFPTLYSRKGPGFEAGPERVLHGTR